jgi:3(or 17)beta-hydroxysteroid dehydrogenase
MIKVAARLINKVALVTGSTNGIGRAITDLFLKNGAKVIGLDIVEPSLNECMNKKFKESFQFYKIDVSCENEWQKIEKIIAKTYGSLDILVNNAGINGLDQNLGPQDPENINLDSWKYIHKNNLESVVLGCKYMIKFMKREAGDASIINIASRSGLVGVPNLIAYASSKASIINFTKSVALYCAEKQYSIRCNVINPGAIETKIWDKILGVDEEKLLCKEKLVQEIPLKKMGQAIDVAYAVLYLASEESNFITASSVLIDGGCTAVTSGRPIKK